MTWLLNNLDVIASLLLAHVVIAVPAIVLTLFLTLPIAFLAQKLGVLRAVLVPLSSLLYAIPSLALFIVLPILLGTGLRDPINVLIAMIIYGLALLIPVSVDALDAVDHRVLDAATAQGMGAGRLALGVALPLAGPSILAGLRVVAVSTISLTTVGAVLGIESLGRLLTDGFQRGLTAEIVTGLVLTVVLALVTDATLVLMGAILMPWSRNRGWIRKRRDASSQLLGAPSTTDRGVRAS